MPFSSSSSSSFSFSFSFSFSSSSSPSFLTGIDVFLADAFLGRRGGSGLASGRRRRRFLLRRLGFAFNGDDLTRVDFAVVFFHVFLVSLLRLPASERRSSISIEIRENFICILYFRILLCPPASERNLLRDWPI